MLKRSISIFVSISLVLVFQVVGSSTAYGLKKYQPKSYISGRCSDDPNAPKASIQIQDFLSVRGRCVGPMYLKNSVMTKSKPVAKVLTVGSANITQCKVKQPASRNEFLGFPVDNDKHYESEKHPSPGTVIQIVGIKGTDTAPAVGKPSTDYKIYIDFMKSWFSNINNTSNPVRIRILDTYVDLAEPIAPYQIFHGETPESKKSQFANKVSAVIDPLIDFSDVNYVIGLVPAATKYSVMNQDGFSGIKLNEGANQAFYMAAPATYKTTEPNNFANFQSPLMWIHELYHPGFNLGDSHGESVFSRKNVAMGEWGMMSTGSTDMIQWQKWLLGFTTDSQVACIDSSQTGRYWLAPGSTKTSKVKLAVIPVSPSEVIIIESVRGTGANFKLGKEEQGALVYTLDTLETARNQSYKVQFPDNRSWKQTAQSMAEAPLRLGDSVVVKGVKITNVEWGEFGDVIKVEPVK